MALLQYNATITVLRGAYNAATKQTSAPAPVSGLAGIPAFVDEIGLDLRLRGVAPEFELVLLWDGRYGIRDGDQIQGWNPTGSVPAPIYQVQHAATDGAGTVLECRIGMLRALKG